MARNRLEAARARTDTRDWAKARRDRTRQLIELGGLVTKAGLVELVDDDRATLLGAMLEIAAQLRGMGDNDPAALRTRWRRTGLRAFAAEREVVGAAEELKPVLDEAEAVAALLLAQRPAGPAV